MRTTRTRRNFFAKVIFLLPFLLILAVVVAELQQEEEEELDQQQQQPQLQPQPQNRQHGTTHNAVLQLDTQMITQSSSSTFDSSSGGGGGGVHGMRRRQRRRLKKGNKRMMMMMMTPRPTTATTPPNDGSTTMMMRMTWNKRRKKSSSNNNFYRSRSSRKVYNNKKNNQNLSEQRSHTGRGRHPHHNIFASDNTIFSSSSSSRRSSKDETSSSSRVDPPPPPASPSDDEGSTFWFTVTGTGSTLRVGTSNNKCPLLEEKEDDDSNNTMEDSTKLSIWNGTCSDLICVSPLEVTDTNSRKPPICEDGVLLVKSITWDSVLGSTYYIFVRSRMEGIVMETLSRRIIVQDTIQPRNNHYYHYHHHHPPNKNDYDSDAVVVAYNDVCEGAHPLQIGILYEGSTTHATLDHLEPCGTFNSAPGVWYSVMGTGTMLRVSTCPYASYDTRLFVYLGGSDNSNNDDDGQTDNNCDALQCVNGNDDFCSLQSAVTWNATRGRQYYIVVHGFAQLTGEFQILIEDVSEEAGEGEDDDNNNNHSICSSAMNLPIRFSTDTWCRES